MGTVHASDGTGGTDLNRSCAPPATVVSLAFLDSGTERWLVQHSRRRRGTGYGTHSALAVAREGELTGADVALGAPGNATLDGTIAPPDGYRVLEKTLGLEVAGLTALLEHAVHVLMLTGGPDAPAVYVVTGAATVQLPELRAGSTYHWFGAAIGPAEGIDAFTGGANFFPALGDSFQTLSATRSFVVR